MSFSKRPGKNTPQCYTKPLDSLKNWNNRFFWVDERVFPTVVDWRVSAPKDEMPVAGSYSPEDVVVLNTRRTPIQKQPEALLCLIGLSRRYFLGDDVYPTFLSDDDREMDLFNLISAPNLTKIKTGTRPRAAHEVPLLIATATRVITMEDATRLSSSSGTPSIVEKSPLDFSNEDSPRRITESDGTKNQGQETVAPEVPLQENVPTMGVTPKIGLEKEVAAMGPFVSKKRRERGGDRVDANAPPKVLRKDHETPAKYGLHPLSYAKPRSIPEREIAQVANGIYQPGWGVTNSCRLESPDVCQDVVDHIVSPRVRNQTKNLEALLEAEVDMKKAAEAKNVELAEELESLCAKFSDLQCAESPQIRQAFADVVSVGLAKGMNEGLQYGIEYGKAGRDLGDVEAYDPEANNKFS
ncbi:hypothetical protein Tco_0668584 [Tanacetum coccineum]